MKKIATVILLIGLGFAALKSENFVNQENFGTWGDVVEAKDQHAAFPAQYYLCGFRFLEQKYVAIISNCDCGRHWYRGRLRYRCRICPNNLFTMSSGFESMFCRYNNWNDQIVRSFTTGSPNARNWRSWVMCPQNTYAIGYAGKFGYEYDNVLGFHGLALKCATTDMKNTANVQDDQGYQAGFFNAKSGNFISGYKLKYEAKGRLSGFTGYAEGLPVVTTVAINYGEGLGIQDNAVVFDEQSITNCGKSVAQKKTLFTKTYQSSSNWILSNADFGNYMIQKDVTVPRPKLASQYPSSGFDSLFKSTTSQFGFGQPVKTTLYSNQEILLFAPPRSEMRITSSVQEQKGKVPFSATLVISNLVTGEAITKMTVTGIWDGSTTSSVDTKVVQASGNCPEEGAAGG